MPKNSTLSTLYYGIGNWELMFTKDQSHEEKDRNKSRKDESRENENAAQK